MKALRLADIRKFVKTLHSAGVSIERRNNVAYCLYDQRFNAVVIPRKLRGQKLTDPVVSLFHEGGHALNFTKLNPVTLNPKTSLARFRSNRRYPALMGSLLDFAEHPSNLILQTSDKIARIESYRKIRRELFLEMQANTEALRHLPEGFKKYYNLIAAEHFKVCRNRLKLNPHTSTCRYFSNLLKLTETHYIKPSNTSLQS